MFLKKFRLHRNGSIRLRHYNYAQNGYYFVTICSKYRINIFGEVVRGKMKYNILGLMAKKYWQQIPKHFPFVKLDKFVIMPDHVHGIIVINKTNGTGAHDYDVGLYNGGFVGVQDIARLQKRPILYKNTFGPQSQNLASIVRGYKIAVKKYAVMNNIPFLWQPRYYEHVIRDERALDNVRRYIRNNPIMWHN